MEDPRPFQAVDGGSIPPARASPSKLDDPAHHGAHFLVAAFGGTLSRDQISIGDDGSPTGTHSALQSAPGSSPYWLQPLSGWLRTRQHIGLEHSAADRGLHQPIPRRGVRNNGVGIGPSSASRPAAILGFAQPCCT